MMPAKPLPQLVSPRSSRLETVRAISGEHFDVDAWHVMEERDNALIADEVLHGAGSSTFVYSFEIAGKTVAGVSVIGARFLAFHYKGLKHRLIGSAQKTGALFTFQSFDPVGASATVMNELESEPDFYEVLAEMQDIKTGNTLQMHRRELRFEHRQDGSLYERPNYQTIAESKVYRNLVIALVPQDVRIEWQQLMLKLKKTETITTSVLDEKRANVLKFAAAKAVQLDRHAVEQLTFDQIGGLGDAAREGKLPAFVNAAKALGLELGAVPEEATLPTDPPTSTTDKGKGGRS